MFSNSFSRRFQDLQFYDGPVTRLNCNLALSNLVTACEIGDSCTEPNTRTFVLSTEQVCSAINSRTKLKVETIGDLFEFRNFAVKGSSSLTASRSFIQNLNVTCCKDLKDDDKWYRRKSSCPYTLREPPLLTLAYPDAEVFCEEEEKGRL